MSRASVGAVILAAGPSTRLGQPKQLLEAHGTTLLRFLATEALASSCDRVAVVLGASAPGAGAALGGLGVSLVRNALWEEGIASSIRCGVSWATREGYDAILLMLCDQPRLRREHLECLLLAFRTTGSIVASRYDGVLGAPAIFDRGTFADLLALRGERGARGILRGARRIVALDWPDGAVDIDRPEDLPELSRT